MSVKPSDSQITEVNKTEQPKVEKEKVNVPVAAPVVQAEESKEDRNWKKFREEREKERKTLEEVKRKGEESERQASALKAALEAVTNRAYPQAIQPEYVEETEEQRINKAVSKAIQENERHRLRLQQEKEQQELPHKLAQTYQNFNEVCSDDNLDYLQYHYPEVYHTFKSAPDSFDKWGNVYKAIKRFVPNTDSKKEEKKIEQNAKKPQSMSVPGAASTAESIPYKADEKRRADNWARMQRTLKGLNA